MGGVVETISALRCSGFHKGVSMKRFFLALLFLALANFTGTAQIANQKLIQHVDKSVTLLFSQNDDGGMRMRCTATAYRKTDKGYRFVSAAHCVDGKTESEQADVHYFVSADDAGNKTYIPAKLLAAGDKMIGDDFSIFVVESTDVFEIVSLGDNTTLALGAPVVNIASPLGLGKQLFTGYVSSTHVDRPSFDAGDVKWRDVMLVVGGGGPGSSGSSIVSVEQEAIVGFLVGEFTEGQLGMIVVPVSKFKTFEGKVDDGSYKKEHRFDFLHDLMGSDHEMNLGAK